MRGGPAGEGPVAVCCGDEVATTSTCGATSKGEADELGGNQVVWGRFKGLFGGGSGEDGASTPAGSVDAGGADGLAGSAGRGGGDAS
jgi:hypothetical protein